MCPHVPSDLAPTYRPDNAHHQQSALLRALPERHQWYQHNHRSPTVNIRKMDMPLPIPQLDDWLLVALSHDRLITTIQTLEEPPVTGHPIPPMGLEQRPVARGSRDRPNLWTWQVNKLARQGLSLHKRRNEFGNH
ncbi:hypothetical protein UY3_18638 [Chelonia mydas]|uniref:Uncharacterized protein n=1 Tax=Chelonia mydas TaxID=8469 RepID=M7ANS4_CHEMY|nr:hypothetical protein UY3_18638 [Chelonia mydas]